MIYKDPPIFNFKGKDIKWKFQSIVPYNDNGYQCNVLIEWENRETTNKLLKVTGTDDSVTCVIYTHEDDPLEKLGWKHPKTYEQARGLDKRNGNTLRGDSTTLELTQINDYYTFIGKGHASIRVRTEEPDSCDLSDNVHDLIYIVYVKLEELLPIGTLEPLGNHTTWSHYVDANLLIVSTMLIKVKDKYMPMTLWTMMMMTYMMLHMSWTLLVLILLLILSMCMFLSSHLIQV
jgi:hypothetical protein